ncbi:hypothetical protein LTR66_005525 [Elasticomyces elasticus]|nr:hypothetical protein LTR66_005525 [Elasticomyces elasticus]KAK5010248.1 hypothetical protein LTR28_011010 [Elasticomyces elasticus]
MLASGFTDAPVSQILVIGIVASSLLANVADVKHYFWIGVRPHLWDYWQVWRLLTWQSFILFTLPYTTLIPPLLLALVIRPLTFNRINVLPAGPTAIMFAILAQYHAAIPYIYKYRVSPPSPTSDTAGVMLTSKSTPYLLPLQLALSQLPGSAIAAAVGWVVGYAYRYEVLPGAARWRFPDSMKWRTARADRLEELPRGTEGDAALSSGAERRPGGGRRRGLTGEVADRS